MRILIVEDDFSSQQLLSRYLKSQGETVIAEDGEKAVRQFQKALDSRQPFDLICLDIMLPIMDGQEVLKQIRSIEEARGIGGLEGCKIIMLTALRDAENIMMAFRSQCEVYISKPIAKDILYREIQNLGLSVNSDS